MRNTIKNLSMLFFIAIFVLAGCGGGSSSSSSDSSNNAIPPDESSYQISGTAATGKPIAFGTVTLKDSTGVSVNTVTDANGNFSFEVVGNSPSPYMLRAAPDVPGGIPLYSYAQNMAGTTPTTVNITPLTSLILFESFGRSDPGQVFDSGDFSKLTVSAIDSAHDMVRANFSSQLTDNGVNPEDINLLSTPFVADSSGVDGVMDEVNVSLLGSNAYINDSGGLCVTYGSNLSGVTIAIDGMRRSAITGFFGIPPIIGGVSDGYIKNALEEACVSGLIENVIWTRNPALTDTRMAVDLLKTQLDTAYLNNKLVESRGGDVGPINIVAHSWGTVIAYIALIELENEFSPIKVQNLITMGSPVQYLAENSTTLKFGTLGILNRVQASVPDEFKGVAIRKPGNVNIWTNFYNWEDIISTVIVAANNVQVEACSIASSPDCTSHSVYYDIGLLSAAPTLFKVRSLINFSRADSSPLPSIVQPPSLATPTPPSDFTLTAGIPYCDTRAPAGPAIELSWSASTDAVNYRVYRNNKAIGVNLDSGQHSFINELGLVAGESYEFKVMALNADGTTWSDTYSASIPDDVCASVSTAQSELAIQNLSVNPGSGLAGSTATVSFTVRNQGSGTASANTTNIRINTSSSTVTTGDPLLLGVSIPSIAAGGTYNVNRTVTIPGGSSAGLHYVWVIADVNSTANQANEANDKARTAFTVTTATAQSDLVIQNLSVNPGSGLAGSTATVSFTVRNQGSGTASANTTNIRINTSSSTVATGDPLLLGVSIPSIAAGGTYNVNRTVTIPGSSSAGLYYAWVIADVNSTANQTNEANDKARTAFTVTTITYLPAPLLTSPPNGGINQLTTPALIWSAVAGATSYRIMVATNPALLPSDPAVGTCSGCVINNVITSTFYIPSAGTLGTNTTYYWQVHARSPDYYGLWSGIWSFTTL